MPAYDIRVVWTRRLLVPQRLELCFDSCPEFIKQRVFELVNVCLRYQIQ